MKKLLTLAAALLLFVGVSSAQTYFNIGYGVGMFNWNGEYSAGDDSNIFYAGISHNFRFGDFVGFELGANFAYDIAKTKRDASALAVVMPEYEGYPEGTMTGWRTENPGIVVPALFNYKLALSRDLCFKIFLGPTFKYGLKYTGTEYIGKEDGYTNDHYADASTLQRCSVWASAAVAMEVAEAFRVKIGYDYGLTDIYPKESSNVKENVLNFSLSYMF